jgi:SHS2 domain-containing protein
MEDKARTIEELSVEEREEILIDIARILENTAFEAVIEGEKQFAVMTNNMAEAIRVHSDELARNDLENAERLLQEATAMIDQFNAAHPYRIVSRAVH